MSESNDVQRVRVVNAWAVKTAKGDYLDASAVNTVNTLIVVLLLGLTLYWIAAVVVQMQALMVIHGSDIIQWPPSMLGTLLVLAANFLAAAVHLVGINLIVRHNANTPFLIQLGCGLLGTGALLQLGRDIAGVGATFAIYAVIAWLIGIVRPYYRR